MLIFDKDNEPEPALRSSKVLIVGKGTGWENALLYLPTDWSVWTIPQSFVLLNYSSSIDLVFEVHEPKLWRRKKNILYNINKTYTIPKLIVPQRVPKWTDNSYLLPVEKLQALDLPLLNSFAWMIAYAIYRNVTDIMLRGINLTCRHEAEQERDSMMFMVGYARARGIGVDIDSSSGLRTINGPSIT